MHELELKEIKEIAFSVLKHFDSFSKENNINYYLSNGTLLGAVKYNGFIPWDDDIDVLVPRGDYNKMIKIYKDGLQYKLFSTERNLEFRYPFAKLCDMSTLKIEENIDNGIDLGVDIDIFPLDSCTAYILKTRRIKKITWLQRACVVSKIQGLEGKNIIKKLIIKYCQWKGYFYYAEKLKQNIIRESLCGDMYKGCLTWLIYGAKEIIPADVFDSVVEVEFEGEKFPAPVGYDTYLRSLYGNYENDPPLEKQKTHHNFKAYRIV